MKTTVKDMLIVCSIVLISWTLAVLVTGCMMAQKFRELPPKSVNPGAKAMCNSKQHRGPECEQFYIPGEH